MAKIFDKQKWRILILFGLIGQIAWSVENMYFNLFVFERISPNLNAVTLMVQASGIAATVVTLVAGAISDKIGNRRSMISIGYLIWGITVAIFGFITPANVSAAFGIDTEAAVRLCLITVIVGDCVMTLFGSTANDAAFNAWVTDNTDESYRGKTESVLSVMPLISTLIVAGGFGIIVELIDYDMMFLLLGSVITLSGVIGLFIIKDSDTLEKSGTLKDIFYGFKPSSVRSNKPFYVALLILCIYSIGSQIYMPYLIIYMKTYLGFSTVEYSIAFGAAILGAAAINIFLGPISDKRSKPALMYIATAVYASGLLLMFVANGMEKLPTLIIFAAAGFIMMTGFIFITSLCGAVIRDHTPDDGAGKLQGVRMIFSVLIPMLTGPMIGNAINAAANIPLADAGADAMTTSYIPSPYIFLAGALVVLLMLALIPLLQYTCRISKKED